MTRWMEVELSDGSRYSGAVLHEDSEQLSLEVEGRPLQLRRSALVYARYLEAEAAKPSPGAGSGPLRIQRRALVGPREEALLSALGERALLVFLPSRVPRAWETASAAAPSDGGPFPLWSGDPSLSPERTPHLLALNEAALPLLHELPSSGGVYCRSAAPAQLLARYLGHLRQAYDPRGRRIGLRFYDPGVLQDLWALGDPATAGILCGSAWTRPPQGRDELLCPACDAPLPPLATACARCPAAFLGLPVAPYLIGSWFAEARGLELVSAEPWPQSPQPGSEPPLRPRQRGRKAFFFSDEQLAALGAAYRARVTPDVRCSDR